ncbi:beta-ketoacyl synthase N-terminal-like domain-containing protein [Amycolatopsis sp. H20-H5]|uniref:beta-ketoacyl synthase N-terminal-like domain-containing protein n=1 Tax=Amycolatopsis sp. H20-H5 TaxID=3046309 RepID=UPI002DBC216E|nr:beta-ketoacyl synthase N-terminal-like domain-containing protein [Amycolatopsis sp. H20-H5]MEC3975547.1 beta-ketoacyl synthase N-terminal-like domain-containing protein [Amycolatopsis sp. H20-H5]
MNPVITEWTAVSPFGIDRDSFVAGVRSRRAAVVESGLNGAPHKASRVPGFEIRELLGRKGTRSMDRVTGLAVWTVRQLISQRPPERGDRTALVLGTMGSLQSTMDFSRSSFVEARPYFVDPERMPGSIMNAAAGSSAIWHGLTGPNVTLASGRVSGLSALGYALRLLRSKRAPNVLTGAVEEYSSARSWIESHSGLDGVLGEGCVMLRLEPPGVEPALAEVLAIKCCVALDQDFAVAASTCVDGVLAAAGVSEKDVAGISWSGLPGVTDPLAELIGDTGAASAMFQIAEVLATGEPGSSVIVGSADRDGMVVCALLRLGGRS